MEKDDVIKLIQIYSAMTQSAQHVSDYSLEAEPNKELPLALKKQHWALEQLGRIIERELPEVPPDQWDEYIDFH